MPPGGFVVGEDGLGYTDIGEEIDWTNEDLAEQEQAKRGNTKGDGQKNGPGTKRKAADQPKPGAKARMQKMFQTAATKTKKAAVDDKLTDALLDDILGGLDAGTYVFKSFQTDYYLNNND